MEHGNHDPCSGIHFKLAYHERIRGVPWCVRAATEYPTHDTCIMGESDGQGGNVKKQSLLPRKSKGESQQDADQAATRILLIVQKGGADGNVDTQPPPRPTVSRLYGKYQKSRRLAALKRGGMRMK